MMAPIMAAVAVAAPAAPAKDWSRVTNRTPAGAFVLGNPGARVKLVEYLSLTCSHCAQFTLQGLPLLKRDYIAKGLVSLEVRHAVRDGFDLSATLLARCEGPAAYFLASDLLFRQQEAWLARAVAWQQAGGAPPAGATPGIAAQALAKGAGLDAVMRGRGMSPARAQACLANAADQTLVAAMTQEAWQERRIPGTPAFLINGVLVDGANDWARLEPQVKAALNGRVE